MSLETADNDFETLTYEYGLWCPQCGENIPDQDMNDLGVCAECAQKQLDWAANPEEVTP
jgi:Zn finger protein HypA/HybF involved in hydrogenase expression